MTEKLATASPNNKDITYNEAKKMQRDFNIAPLSGAFMITSITGFLISAFYVLPISRRWGFTFVLFFTLMFIASLISMTYAPSDWPLNIGKRGT